MFHRFFRRILFVLIVAPSVCTADQIITEVPDTIDPITVIQGQTNEFAILVWNTGDSALHLDFTSYFEFTDSNSVSYTSFLEPKGREIGGGTGHGAPCIADLDNDGDYDLLIWSSGGTLSYYQSDGSAQSRLWRLADPNALPGHPGAGLAPEVADIDDDGDYDLFAGRTDGTLSFYENTGSPNTPVFSLVTTDYLGEVLGASLVPAFIDIDADGDLDLFLGTSSRKLMYYRNDGSPVAAVFTFVSDSLVDISSYSWPAPDFVDIDSDGDYDLFCGYRYGLAFFENTGAPNSPSFAFVTDHYGANDVTIEGGNPEFADFDADGDLDLYALYYPSGNMLPRYLYHFENVGSAASASWVLAEEKVKHDLNIVRPNEYANLCFAEADIASGMLPGSYDPNIYLSGSDDLGNSYSAVISTVANQVTVLSSAPPTSGLAEEPNSISPATVEQWSKCSFSIDVENVDGNDIRLDPNTELSFGGTWALRQSMFGPYWAEFTYTAKLAEEVVVPSGATRTLVFERDAICGGMFEKDYNPQLELSGTYVNSGTPYSQTVYTQANPITVTYMELWWSNGAGASPGNQTRLVYKNGGYLQSVGGGMTQNVPGDMRWQFPDSGDPGFDFEMRLDPKYIEQDNTSIIDFVSNPPYKVWIVFIDNHDYLKQSRVQFAVYPRVDTLLNHRYEGRISIRPKYVMYECGGGLLIGATASYELYFDDDVELDIVSIECSASTLSYGEVLDVNVTIENMKEYPILLTVASDQTYLTFTSEASDVSSFFEVMYPTANISIPGSATETVTFSITPICAVPLGVVTIDPTISYHNYFADGNGVIELSGEKTGSLYPTPVTATFDMVSDVNGVVYVDANALPGGDGASWETAYQTIKTGIGVASCGFQVWVAAGTYAEAIEMKSDVQLYGGFEGTETLLSERNIAVNATIIDASTADAGGPANHVVTMDGITNARIDGFTITGGNANGSWPYDGGGGIFCDSLDNTNTIANCTIIGNFTDYKGGGVNCDNSSPQITNCTISGNSASSYGGGVYCLDCSLSLTNCTISGNQSNGGGGGLYCAGSSLSLTNCTISGNSSGYRGGGVFCSGSSPSITNCTISSNQPSSYGGGLCCEFSSKPSITSTIFEDNTHRAIYEDDDGSDPTVAYCLFYNNPDGDYYDRETGLQTGANNINANVAEAHDNVDGNPLFVMSGHYGVIGTWTQDPNYDPNVNRTTLTDANALFAEGELVGKLINADTTQWQQALILANTPNSIEVLGDLTGYVSAGDTYQIIDYHLQSSSPCIDAGDPNYIAGPNDVDIDGQPRVVGDRVDIGADEFAYNGDFNFNGSVDLVDFAIFALAWLSEPGYPEWNSACDISIPPDSFINTLDLSILLQHWLEGTTP